MVRNQRHQANGEMERCRTQNDKSKREDNPYSYVFTVRKRVSSNANVEKKLFTSIPNTSIPELKMGNDSGREPGMAQPSAKDEPSEPDFDLNLSVDDVTTLVQHGTLDLAEATRERHATHRLPEFTWSGRSFMRSWIPDDSLNGTNMCDGTVHVIGKLGYHDNLQRIHKYKRRKRMQTNWHNK